MKPNKHGTKYAQYYRDLEKAIACKDEKAIVHLIDTLCDDLVDDWAKLDKAEFELVLRLNIQCLQRRIPTFNYDQTPTATYHVGKLFGCIYGVENMYRYRYTCKDCVRLCKDEDDVTFCAKRPSYDCSRCNPACADFILRGTTDGSKRL